MQSSISKKNSDEVDIHKIKTQQRGINGQRRGNNRFNSSWRGKQQQRGGSRRQATRQPWQQQQEHQQRRADGSDQKASTSGYSSKCFCCGKLGHFARECKHNKSVCHNCNRRGHLSSVCREEKSHQQSTKFGYVSKYDEESGSEGSCDLNVKEIFKS